MPRQIPGISAARAATPFSGKSHDRVMQDIKKSLRAFFGRLGEYYRPIKVAMRFGHHRDLSLARVFMSQVVLDTISKLRPFNFFRRSLDGILVKHRQLLVRHPSFVADPRNLTLQMLSVSITYHCNRKCPFCYARGLAEEFKEHMSLADFEFLARWAKAQGWTSLRLLGGEPTVHPEFKAILELAGKYGFTLSPSSNGLFDPEKNPFLDKRIIKSITYSYPQDDLPRHEMEIFYRNVEHAMFEMIPVTLSWVVEPDDDGWRKVIDLAKKHRTKAAVRFSMVLPGHRRNFGPEEFRQKMQGLSGQIMDIVSYAHENSVVISFYRPLLRCMFDQEQFNFLKSISPFMFYTRCPLCLKGEYDCDLRLNVNPDLSCYPCNALSFKGIKTAITPGTTRGSINEFFKPLMRRITAQPLMDSCLACRFFANYQRHLEDKPQDLADKTVCQGGCFQYRA